jgi:hypothetical protein
VRLELYALSCRSTRSSSSSALHFSACQSTLGAVAAIVEQAVGVALLVRQGPQHRRWASIDLLLNEAVRELVLERIGVRIVAVAGAPCEGAILERALGPGADDLTVLEHRLTVASREPLQTAEREMDDTDRFRAHPALPDARLRSIQLQALNAPRQRRYCEEEPSEGLANVRDRGLLHLSGHGSS